MVMEGQSAWPSLIHSTTGRRPPYADCCPAGCMPATAIALLLPAATTTSDLPTYLYILTRHLRLSLVRRHCMHKYSLLLTVNEPRPLSLRHSAFQITQQYCRNHHRSIAHARSHSNADSIAASLYRRQQLHCCHVGCQY